MVCFQERIWCLLHKKQSRVFKKPLCIPYYIDRITKYCKSWENRGYEDGISGAVPENLERRNIAPSWKALSKAILKNDYWFRSVNMIQPFSKTYGEYLKLKSIDKNP